MAGCSADDSICCSGTVFCARAKAPVQQRQELFNAWLGGLFMVAPFVDVLMQFIVPMLTYWFHLKADRILDEDERLKPRSCCCGCLSGLGRLLAFIFVLDGGVMGLPYVWRGYPFKAPKIKAEADDGPVPASLNHLFGPLDQRLLRPFNPIDELKMLKMNFMIVIMFAPINPVGLIAQLVARLLDIHSRLPKLLIVRRRDSPMDNNLAHISQQVFGHIILPFAAIWHVGLALISYNTDLYKYDHSVLVVIWFTIAGVIAGLALLLFIMAFKVYYRFNPHARRTMSSLSRAGSLGTSLDPSEFRDMKEKERIIKEEMHAEENEETLANAQHKGWEDPVLEAMAAPGKVPEVVDAGPDPVPVALEAGTETGNLGTPSNAGCCACTT